MIRSFKHRGLKALYDGRSAKRINPAHQEKLRDILALLDAADSPAGLDIPGLRLHPLKGRMKGHHAVTVSGNWRVIFRFEGGDACDIDYLDYH